MKAVDFIIHVWYYQSWLCAMAFAMVFIRDRVISTATYVFLAYVAVAWHPLVEEILKWSR